MKNEGLYDRGYLVKYTEGDVSLYRTPLNYVSSSMDKYHVIRDNDTLLSISQEYYDVQYLWYIIADVNANIIDDIFNLPVNETIVIPDLELLEAFYG